jgi:hypothetical protein
MPRSLQSEIDTTIQRLVERARVSTQPADHVMKFTQAVLNLANAACTLRERDERQPC